MGTPEKVFGRWLFGLWLLAWGLTGCAAARIGALPPTPVTVTPLQAAVTAAPPESNVVPSATVAPEIPATPTATLTPVPPTPTAVPQSPTLSPTALACWSQPGRIEKGYLTPDYLPRWLLYRVYLPPCYDEQPERRYPVLYLLHGQSYTEDQWIRLGVPETADALIASGQVPPFIVVMPGDRVWTQPSADNFGKALVEALIPTVDDQYRTLPDRAHRAIGGLSRGAGWAVHLGLSHWDLFGAIGAHSLPVFWEDVPDIKGWINQIPAQDMPRIYMDIGNRDRPEVMQSAVWFENLLTEMGIPHEWHLFSGEHTESYWKSHVEQYLLWYAANW